MDSSKTSKKIHKSRLQGDPFDLQRKKNSQNFENRQHFDLFFNLVDGNKLRELQSLFNISFTKQKN